MAEYNLADYYCRNVLNIITKGG